MLELVERGGSRGLARGGFAQRHLGFLRRLQPLIRFFDAMIRKGPAARAVERGDGGGEVAIHCQHVERAAFWRWHLLHPFMGLLAKAQRVAQAGLHVALTAEHIDDAQQRETEQHAGDAPGGAGGDRYGDRDGQDFA